MLLSPNVLHFTSPADTASGKWAQMTSRKVAKSAKICTFSVIKQNFNYYKETFVFKHLEVQVDVNSGSSWNYVGDSSSMLSVCVRGRAKPRTRIYPAHGPQSSEKPKVPIFSPDASDHALSNDVGVLFPIIY